MGFNARKKFKLGYVAMIRLKWFFRIITNKNLTYAEKVKWIKKVCFKNMGG